MVVFVLKTLFSKGNLIKLNNAIIKIPVSKCSEQNWMKSYPNLIFITLNTFLEILDKSAPKNSTKTFPQINYE